MHVVACIAGLLPSPTAPQQRKQNQHQCSWSKLMHARKQLQRMCAHALCIAASEPAHLPPRHRSSSPAPAPASTCRTRT